MSRTLRTNWKFGILAVILGVGAALPYTLAENPQPKAISELAQVATQAQDDPEPNDGRPISDLKQFMRGKLSASNKILEGLTTEDMALVLDGARTLNKMSLSAKWRAHNDAMYRQFSAEFQRVTGDLVKAAEQDNADQAVLKWMGATMACIECHRFVRNTLVVKAEEFK